MKSVLMPGEAAALPGHASDTAREDAAALRANQAWEVDRLSAIELSERRAWRVAGVGLAIGVAGILAVVAQGPLRSVVEIPIVVDRVTGETTIQQRLREETVPAMDALDKHNLATFLRAREGYSWNFLQRDFDQVARMAVPAVFADYNRQFEGPDALHKRIGGAEEWRIDIIGVRLAASGRQGSRGEASVTYDKVVRQIDRALPDVKSRHVASVVFEYQPKVLARERDRLENPFGFVVTAYRSDPEINTSAPGARP